MIDCKKALGYLSSVSPLKKLKVTELNNILIKNSAYEIPSILSDGGGNEKAILYSIFSYIITHFSVTIYCFTV
jgi:hypothetical protein